MFVPLFLLYLAHSTINASPLPVVTSESIGIHDAPSATCGCNERSLPDILWSCFATIFACTWVSVHQNIPERVERWWMPVHKLELMGWALIAPELIIVWAMRQWIGARKLRDKYGGLGWTVTHGHFLQMGGFKLIDEGKTEKVLTSKEFHVLLQAGKIAFPTITEEEIWDRSKIDGLSKGLTIVQTAWFIGQWITRAAQGLETTELEVITLALALLNGVIYFLWWSKPVDISCPVPITLLHEARDRIEVPIFNPQGRSSRFCGIYSSIRKFFLKFFNISLIWKYIYSYVLGKITGTITSLSDRPLTRLSNVVGKVISGFYQRIKEPVLTDETRLPSQATHVGTFYADSWSRMENGCMSTVAAILSTGFAAIHCLAWNYTFPSFAEKVVWRVSSLFIMSVPSISIFRMGIVWLELNSSISLNKRQWVTLDVASHVLNRMATLGYLIARLCLVTEAFISLRALPPGAYTKVQWTAVLPHI